MSRINVVCIKLKPGIIYMMHRFHCCCTPSCFCPPWPRHSQVNLPSSRCCFFWLSVSLTPARFWSDVFHLFVSFLQYLLRSSSHQVRWGPGDVLLKLLSSGKTLSHSEGNASIDLLITSVNMAAGRKKKALSQGLLAAKTNRIQSKISDYGYDIKILFFFQNPKNLLTRQTWRAELNLTSSRLHRICRLLRVLTNRAHLWVKNAHFRLYRR